MKVARSTTVYEVANTLTAEVVRGEDNQIHCVHVIRSLTGSRQEVILPSGVHAEELAKFFSELYAGEAQLPASEVGSDIAAILSDWEFWFTTHQETAASSMQKKMDETIVANTKKHMAEIRKKYLGVVRKEDADLVEDDKAPAIYLFHGGCHGCTRQLSEGLGGCAGCQNLEADWSLPDNHTGRCESQIDITHADGTFDHKRNEMVQRAKREAKDNS